jgi:transposase
MEKILAIDLGKFKSAVYIFERSSFTSKFRKIKTSGQILHDLFVEVEPDIVLFEVGTSAGWISDMLISLKMPFKVANTNHPAWKWRNNTKKTDRDDAYRLVTMYVHGTFPSVHMPTKEVRQKRSLVRYRQSIVKRVTQSKNTIRSILHSVDISMAAGRSDFKKKKVYIISYLRVSISFPYTSIQSTLVQALLPPPVLRSVHPIDRILCRSGSLTNSPESIVLMSKRCH